MRIVSLLPSSTEIVYALGLGRRLVGVGHDSDRPPEVRSKRVVTRPVRRLSGLRSRTIHRIVTEADAAGASLVVLDDEALAELRPDIVLTAARGGPLVPDRRSVEAALRDATDEVAIVDLDPMSLEGVLHAISTVGAMTGAEHAAMRTVERMRGRLGRIERKVQRRRDQGRRPTRVAALEWLDPPTAAGRWIPEQIRRAGGWDVLGREGEPPAVTSWRAIREVDPEMLILMPARMHVHDAVDEWARVRRPAAWDRLEAVRRGQVFVVDGAWYFGRPGPGVIDGIGMLAEILDPDAFVDTAPLGSWTPVD